MHNFEELKELLQSDEWPKAVPDPLICDTENENDKKLRANEILSFMINSPLKNKKVLDFGCGEGHMAVEAAKKATQAVGYDIRSVGKLSWEKKQKNWLLTTDYSKIEHEEFDIVVLYDVLDHSVEEEPSSILKKAIKHTIVGGHIYVRCHPWVGRHGGHLYQQINKAFVHAVFTEEELKSMGYELEPIRKVWFPQATYKKWFRNAGIENVKPLLDARDPEEFFEQDIISERLKRASEKKKYPKWQMRQSFLDYVVKVV